MAVAHQSGPAAYNLGKLGMRDAHARYHLRRYRLMLIIMHGPVRCSCAGAHQIHDNNTATPGIYTGQETTANKSLPSPYEIMLKPQSFSGQAAYEMLHTNGCLRREPAKHLDGNLDRTRHAYYVLLLLSLLYTHQKEQNPT